MEATKSESITHAWVQSQRVFLLTPRADGIIVSDFPPMESTSLPASIHRLPGVTWPLPLASPFFRHYTTSGVLRPTLYHIRITTVGIAQWSLPSIPCIFVDTRPMVDGGAPKIIHSLMPFGSCACHLASDLLITVEAGHRPEGAIFDIRAHPTSSTTPAPVTATLRTNIPPNTWHTAFLASDPCAVSGTLLFKEVHEETREWLHFFTLFKFE
jgi:hypothetical protein